MKLTFTAEGMQTIVLTNSDICSEEMSLEESLCSDENLRFGACEASCFKVRVVNSASFKDMDVGVEMTIKVDDDKYLIDADGNRIVTDTGDYIIVNLGKKDNSIFIGRYKVFSDEPTNDRMYRDLVCYDYMYDILNAEMSDWYDFVSEIPGFPMTLKTFRDSFFEYLDTVMGIYTYGQVTQTLPNDNFQVAGGFIAEGSLSGKTIIEAICELNGCFGHINKNGKFEYIGTTGIIPSNSIEPKWYINDDTGKYEDYTVRQITGIIARSEANDVGTTVGTMTNPLIIEGNPLIYGKEGTQSLTTALTNILSNVSGLTYRPYKVNTYGNPCLPIGTPIKIVTKKYDPVNGYSPFTINSFVKTRILTGIQGMVDSYDATGTEFRGNEANSIQSQIIRTAGKVHDLKVDLETFESYIQNQNYSTRINQNAEAITLEAQRAQAAEETAGVMTRYEIVEVDNEDVLVIYTNIILKSFTNGTRIAVWVKGIPNQYASLKKYIQILFQQSEQMGIIDISSAYYNGYEPLKNQYKDGVIYHLMYMQNQQFEIEGQTEILSGWWIGADDSYAKIEVTADAITSYVGNNFVSQSAYDAEVQNLQDQIDGRVEYWDGNVVPTLNNAPASSWTTDADKNSHVGDLYRYHHGTPEVTDYYRFDKDTSTTPATYSWLALGASQVDEALRVANEANTKADAAQAQLDAFELTTTGNFTQVRQDIASVNTLVSGVTAREFKSESFNSTILDYSTDGKIYTITPTLDEVTDDTKLSILLQSITWDGTKKKYIRINTDTVDMGENTFPVYYARGEQLTNQIGLGDFLNVKFVSNYETSTGVYADVFVVDNSDQTYVRLESELNIERGRTVLRVRSSDGQLVEQTLDATGTASVWKVKADNIQMTAAQAMSFLAGGTLTLAGQNGVVISSPNFNVYRDGSVTLTGNVTANSGKIGNFLIDSIAGLGYSDNVNHKGMHLHGDELYFVRSNSQGVMQSSTWITSDIVRTYGSVSTPIITKNDGTWAGINADLNTSLTTLKNNIANVSSSVAYVGDYKSADSQGDVSVGSSVKSLAQISLESGVWVITARANFASNTTGDRFLCISTTKDSINGRGQSAVRVDAISGNATQIVTTRIVTSGGTYYLTVEQDSGSTLLCSGGLTAVRIR